MGIIIKESFNQTAVKITLAVIGAVATIFIYPQNLELNGILGFVIDTGVFFTPFILVGLGNTSIKFFYTNNKDSKIRRAYFFSLFKIFILSATTFSILIYIFSDWIVEKMLNTSDDLFQYFSYAIPASLLFAINFFFVQYLSNYKKVAVPVLLQNIYKIILPVVFLAILFFNLSIIVGVWIILLSLSISTLVLLILIFRSFNRVTATSYSEKEKESKSEFYNYYFWAFATTVSTVMAFRVDGFMIPSLMDFTSSGEYRIGLFITSIISIPMQSVLAISAPIVSESWEKKDMDELKTVYYKGSRNLLFIGGAVLLGLIILVQILPLFMDTWKDMNLVLSLVIIIGLTKLFDMFSSTNTLIIQFSPWFRFNTYVVMFLMLTNVVLNYYLILKYGIIGAAIATGISIFLANNLKTYYLYRKMAIHPFTFKSLCFYLLIVAVSFVAFWLNDNQGYVISIVFTAVVGAVLLITYLFGLNLAPETKNIFITTYKKLIKR